MTLNEYQLLAARTMNPELRTTDTVLHALHGMSAEIGEIHGIFQKAYQGHPYTEEMLQKELGDLLWFVSELCTVRGWTLDDVASLNIEKLRDRYPEGFSALRSLNRREGDE